MFIVSHIHFGGIVTRCIHKKMVASINTDAKDV